MVGGGTVGGNQVRGRDGRLCDVEGGLVVVVGGAGLVGEDELADTAWGLAGVEVEVGGTVVGNGGEVGGVGV